LDLIHFLISTYILENLNIDLELPSKLELFAQNMEIMFDDDIPPKNARSDS
jgi:hypothetical protein